MLIWPWCAVKIFPRRFVIDPRVWQYNAYQIIFLNQIHSYDIDTR